MRIDEALSEAKPLDVKFDGGAVLHVEYRPPSYSIRQITEMQADKENPERLIKMVRKIVSAWDLEDSTGEPIPLAEPTDGVDPLRDIPTSIFNAIFRAIREDSVPGELSPSDAS